MAMPAENNIKMFLDYARFRYDETDTYLEMYYMLFQFVEVIEFDENSQKVASWKDSSFDIIPNNF